MRCDRAAALAAGATAPTVTLTVAVGASGEDVTNPARVATLDDANAANDAATDAIPIARGATAPTRTLTVARAGAGRGTVTSSPLGISCGRKCSHAYANRVGVTSGPPRPMRRSRPGPERAREPAPAVKMTAARKVTGRIADRLEPTVLCAYGAQQNRASTLGRVAIRFAELNNLLGSYS